MVAARSEERESGERGSSSDAVSAIVHGPAGPVVGLERAGRARAVLAVVPLVEDAGFTPVLDRMVEEAWQRHVVTSARAISGELLETPFARKLRAGFSTYCGLGLSTLVCARRRPLALRVGSAVVGALGLAEDRVARIGIALLPSFFRHLRARAVERVALTSFLILALDEVLDDVLEGSPAERAHALGVLVRERRAEGADAPLVRLCAAVLAHLYASSSPRERAALDDVLEQVAAWAQDEVALEIPGAVVEPRKRTIEVSMRLLGFGCGDVVEARELRWMEGIARLGQMVDDVLDAAKDAAAGRRTPGVTGEWNAETVKALYEQVVEDTRNLVVSAGERYAPMMSLYERTLRAQLRRMAEILVENP